MRSIQFKNYMATNTIDKEGSLQPFHNNLFRYKEARKLISSFCLAQNQVCHALFDAQYFRSFPFLGSYFTIPHQTSQDHRIFKQNIFLNV